MRRDPDAVVAMYQRTRRALERDGCPPREASARAVEAVAEEIGYSRRRVYAILSGRPVPVAERAIQEREAYRREKELEGLMQGPGFPADLHGADRLWEQPMSPTRRPNRRPLDADQDGGGSP